MGEDIFAALAAHDGDGVRRMLAADPGVAAARNPQGVSAVLWACYVHAPDLARDLAAARERLDVFEAAALDEEEAVRGWLEQDPALAHARTADGFPAVGLAAYFGAPRALDALLAAGADPDAVAENPMQVRPLHAALAGRHTALVARLLAAGADPSAPQHGGWTPLHAAAQHGDEEAVDVLLAAGADPSRQAEDGATPADKARAAGREDLALRLEAPAG